MGASPYDALADVKSAMAYIREHKDRFKIDVDKIILVGSSAGGGIWLSHHT